MKLFPEWFKHLYLNYLQVCLPVLEAEAERKVEKGMSPPTRQVDEAREGLDERFVFPGYASQSIFARAFLTELGLLNLLRPDGKPGSITTKPLRKAFESQVIFLLEKAPKKDKVPTNLIRDWTNHSNTMGTRKYRTKHLELLEVSLGTALAIPDEAQV